MLYITKNWYELLKPELEKPSFQQFLSFLDRQYQTRTIYPKPENIFNSINHIKYDDVKVVIIGQDP
ncbi:MAG TPA: uracil-DNA glycosylase, partial [Clostridiales bacterium]|nr:uracil-DNA glycosylase [Clostridiales bacterium]